MSRADLDLVTSLYWPRCPNASLMLAVLQRLGHPRLVDAAIACARHALPARSTPSPVLVRSLAIIAAPHTIEQARAAARDAHAIVSRHVAGIDDDIALAVGESCDLAAGDPFDLGGTDPAGRAAWALAWHRAGTSYESASRASLTILAELADLIRIVIPRIP